MKKVIFTILGAAALWGIGYVYLLIIGYFINLVA